MSPQISSWVANLSAWSVSVVVSCRPCWAAGEQRKVLWALDTSCLRNTCKLNAFDATLFLTQTIEYFVHACMQLKWSVPFVPWRSFSWRNSAMDSTFQAIHTTQQAWRRRPSRWQPAANHSAKLHCEISTHTWQLGSKALTLHHLLKCWRKSSRAIANSKFLVGVFHFLVEMYLKVTSKRCLRMSRVVTMLLHLM